MAKDCLVRVASGGALGAAIGGSFGINFSFFSLFVLMFMSVDNSVELVIGSWKELVLNVSLWNQPLG